MGSPGWDEGETLGGLIFLQRFAQAFPFFEQSDVRALMAFEFLRLALALIGADEILQRGFAAEDGIFGAADL
jgi:hypothetical protein